METALGVVLAIAGVAVGCAISAALVKYPGWADRFLKLGLIASVVCVLAGLLIAWPVIMQVLPKLEPFHIISFGLIVALVGLVWQQSRPAQPSRHDPTPPKPSRVARST